MSPPRHQAWEARSFLSVVNQGGDAATGNEDAHDAHEGLEHRVAAHRLHRAQRANAAGDKENDDAGDNREGQQDKARGLVLDEGGAPYSAMRPTALPATMFWHWWQCIHDPSARCSHAERRSPLLRAAGAEGGGNQGMMTSFFATMSIPLSQRSVLMSFT